MQPGIKPRSGLDDVEASGMPSGRIIQDDLVQGPDGSEVRTIFMNLGSGDSVEGSFDPQDKIVEIDTIKGSDGAEIRRTQVDSLLHLFSREFRLFNKEFPMDKVDSAASPGWKKILRVAGSKKRSVSLPQNVRLMMSAMEVPVLDSCLEGWYF